MSKDLYKQAHMAAKTEYNSLIVEEGQLNARLDEIKTRKESLKQTMDALGELLGETEDERTTGLTNRILDALKEDPKTGYMPIFLRDKLRDSGFDIDNYRNPMAVIHTTLRRLVDQGKIKCWTKRGSTYYQYVETDDNLPSTITPAQI